MVSAWASAERRRLADELRENIWPRTVVRLVSRVRQKLTHGAAYLAGSVSVRVVLAFVLFSAIAVVGVRLVRTWGSRAPKSAWLLASRLRAVELYFLIGIFVHRYVRSN